MIVNILSEFPAAEWKASGDPLEGTSPIVLNSYSPTPFFLKGGRGDLKQVFGRLPSLIIEIPLYPPLSKGD